jgi:hypothetical protein
VDSEYRELTARVAAVIAREAAEIRTAEEAYSAGLSKIDKQLDATRAAVMFRREKLLRANEDLARVNDSAERVWRDVRSYLGRRRDKRLGEIPEVLLTPMGANPETLLSAAKDLMARAKRGEGSPDLVRYAWVIALLAGAVVAASIFGLARLLLALGTEETLLPNLLAQLAIFSSPFAGIPLVAWGMGRLWGQRAGVETVACTVLGGLVVSCALTFLIH